MLALELLRIFGRHARKCVYAMGACAKEMVLVIQDYFCDKKFGIQTCFDETRVDTPSLYQDEVLYRATSYSRIRKAFDHLRLGADDVFVDLGCGKGRVVLMAGLRPLKKAVGVEIRKSVAEAARENLEKMKTRLLAPVSVAHEDAASFSLDEGTVYFLYDPFGFETFSRVVGNIRESLSRRPRNVRIVYFNARYGDYLDAQEWLEPEGEIGRTWISVWRNRRDLK